MGQAKKRGTFTERKLLAIAKSGPRLSTIEPSIGERLANVWQMLKSLSAKEVK